MQYFETYGFTMEFEDSQAEKYANIKDAVERLCKECVSYSKLYNKPELIQYAPLKNHAYITCAVINNYVEFGIYDKKRPDEIIQQASNTVLENITPEKIKLLQDVMEITAQNKTDIKISPLQELWIELLKQKQNQIYMNKIAEESPER